MFMVGDKVRLKEPIPDGVNPVIFVPIIHGAVYKVMHEGDVPDTVVIALDDESWSDTVAEKFLEVA